MRKALRFPTAVLFLITGIMFFAGNAFEHKTILRPGAKIPTNQQLRLLRQSKQPL